MTTKHQDHTKHDYITLKYLPAHTDTSPMYGRATNWNSSSATSIVACRHVFSRDES